MVGIYEEIIRLGRNYGIGVSMITQRPQSVNKEVLNQTECLFVGQVNGARSATR
jgi:DNA helicase HerA-like ATPase